MLQRDGAGKEIYGIPLKPKVYIHSYTQLRKTACSSLCSNQFHYPNLLTVVIIRKFSTNSHSTFKWMYYHVLYCRKHPRTPALENSRGLRVFIRGGASLNEDHKTLPRSLEVFKMDFSLRLRPSVLALLSINPNFLTSVTSCFECLSKLNRLQLSQWGTEKLLPQTSLYNLSIVSKLVSKSIVCLSLKNLSTKSKIQTPKPYP